MSLIIIIRCVCLFVAVQLVIGLIDRCIYLFPTDAKLFCIFIYCMSYFSHLEGSILVFFCSLCVVFSLQRSLLSTRAIPKGTNFLDILV